MGRICDEAELGDADRDPSLEALISQCLRV
jgi:hypothetical protein